MDSGCWLAVWIQRRSRRGVAAAGGHLSQGHGSPSHAVGGTGAAGNDVWETERERETAAAVATAARNVFGVVRRGQLRHVCTREREVAVAPIPPQSYGRGWWAVGSWVVVKEVGTVG